MATQLNESLNIYWSIEDNCFVCKNSVYPDVIGVGETEAEAKETYFELLNIYIRKPLNLKIKVVDQKKQI